MDAIIDNMDFAQLESLWSATFIDYKIDEYIDTLTSENEDEIIDDIRDVLKAVKKLSSTNDPMNLAFLSRLIEFIDPSLPYFYYCEDEMKKEIMNDIDLKVNAEQFYKYYYRINSRRRSMLLRRKVRGTIVPKVFYEFLNELKVYTLLNYHKLIKFK